jgi:hypothetical protein
METTLSIDQEIEILLTGGVPRDPQLAALAGWVDMMRSLRPTERADDQVGQLVSEAAFLAGASGPATTLNIVPTRQRRRSFRLAPLGVALTGFLVVGLSSVAVASDMAAPGDALYKVDRLLENLGIGDGGLNERITEAGDLMVHGAPVDALVHLDESLSIVDDLVPEQVSERVLIHLELAENMISPNAAEAQRRVASIQAFIEANRGSGVGLDGEEFGQGMSEQAKGETGEGDTEGSDSSGNNGQGQGNGNRGRGEGSGN